MFLKKFFKKSLAVLNNSLAQYPRWSDAGVLIVFTLLITLNPYYLNNRINTYELGLYLPGVNAIQHGLIPFKDFFHLRGPLDLYMPAWLMGMFGTHIGILCFYFFFGNVLCLVLVVLIAKELIRSRFIFYMMIPAIIARTFPRVCFMNWGGMRYAFGLMAVYCFIKFLKKKSAGWLIPAGFLTACAALTSIEMGFCVGAAVVICLAVGWVTRSLSSKEVYRGLLFFIGTLILGISPWLIYSLQQQAFIPYLDALKVMTTRFLIVINPHLASIYPNNLIEALAAMINPVNANFKQLTPAYAYLFLLVYLISRWNQKKWGIAEQVLVFLGIFGLTMYMGAFRALLASQFEMALMPEKIIYFFLVEAVILSVWLKPKKQAWQTSVIGVLLIALFCFSIGYTLTRYNKRFWAFQYASSFLSPKKVERLKYWDKNEKYEQLNIDRAKGIWVPVDQAKDFNQLNEFIAQHSQKNDTFVMFPEVGIYHFLFDRPFLSRFPFCTFAWFDDQWFDEYFNQFKVLEAKFVVVQKHRPEGWEKIYFGYVPNKIKYDQMISVIDQSYIQVAETEENWIYERK